MWVNLTMSNAASYGIRCAVYPDIHASLHPLQLFLLIFMYSMLLPLQLLLEIALPLLTI